MLAQFHAYSRFFTPRLAWRAQDLLRALSRTGLLVGSSSAAELEGERPSDHRWRMVGFQQRHGERLIETLPSRDDHACALARRYDDHMSRASLETPQGGHEARLLRYPLLVGNEAELLDAARAEPVELGSSFDTPLHPVALAHHGSFGYHLGQCPNAERLADPIVNPLHPRVAPAEADRIARCVVQRAARPAE